MGPRTVEFPDKNDPAPVETEEYLRAAIRAKARESYQDNSVELGAEVIGIACEVTGIKDPSAAIKELVEQALGRWARIRVIERMAAMVESDAGLTKRATVGPSKKHKPKKGR